MFFIYLRLTGLHLKTTTFKACIFLTLINIESKMKDKSTTTVTQQQGTHPRLSIIIGTLEEREKNTLTTTITQQQETHPGLLDLVFSLLDALNLNSDRLRRTFEIRSYNTSSPCPNLIESIFVSYLYCLFTSLEPLSKVSMSRHSACWANAWVQTDSFLTKVFPQRLL